MTDRAGRFAANYAALCAAHDLADHWVQTSHQAANKGLPGWRGRRACAAHVATYTATQAVALAAVNAFTGQRPRWGRLAAGLAVSAGTHYWADRRTTLVALAERVGLAGFYSLGVPRDGHDDNPNLGTGAYALDQAWHHAWTALAAAIAAA